jgi:CRP-like cAMP-binding protein
VTDLAAVAEVTTPDEGSTVPATMAHEEQLARTDFFGGAAPALLRELAAQGSELPLIRGDVLFREGDTAESLYLVISGRIAIVIANPIDHRETVVALMDSGDLFGEMALLDDGPRSAMARALEPSTVFAIPFAPVIKAFRNDPTLLWGVTRLLAHRLRVMDEALADSVFLDVTGRTAKRLLELSAGADEFVLPITQEELAGMVGASRERVNKSIASFIRLGWIDQHDRQYTITRRDALELRAR